MDENVNTRSLIPLPDASLANKTAGAQRILSAMVTDTLGLANENAKLQEYFQSLEFEEIVYKKVITKVCEAYRLLRKNNHSISEEEIINRIIHERYCHLPAGDKNTLIIQDKRAMAKDISSLCYLIAEVEFLSYLMPLDRISIFINGKNIVDHIYGVIDKERYKYANDGAMEIMRKHLDNITAIISGTKVGENPPI